MGEVEIAQARGDLLAGLAALQGLSDLLRSRRVGAKALARALPEVGEGFAQLDASIGAMFAAVAPPLGRAGAVLERSRQLLAMLRIELDAARSNLDARHRISLEAQLTGARRELEAVHCIGELAAAAAAPRSAALDLAEVVRHRWSGATREGDPSVAVRVELGAGASFAGDPRLAMALVELGVSSVLAAGVVHPRVTASRREDGRLVVRVDDAGAPAGPSPEAMLVRTYLCRAETVALAVEVAGRAGVEVAHDASGRAVSIVL